MKRKIEPDYVASWRITAMSNWDKDYIDEEEPGRIVIEADGDGTIRFGLVQAGLDCRMEHVGGVERLTFSFVGLDEVEGTSGYGWAVVTGGRLEGELYFYLGDDSTFSARKEKKR